MKRLTLVLIAACLPGLARAQQEDVSIRGNFPQVLAIGETTAQMASRIAVTIGNLDRLIAPPCGMRRVFEFAGAGYLDANDVSRPLKEGQPGGVWRIVVTGNGCWTPRVHNVFVYPRGDGRPADLRLGVPGRSAAGVKHQQDATQLVLREANAIAARENCGDRAFVVETAVVRARQAGKAWEESWSAQTCETTRKFKVMFTPEGEKMRIGVVLAE